MVVDRPPPPLDPLGHDHLRLLSRRGGSTKQKAALSGSLMTRFGGATRDRHCGPAAVSGCRRGGRRRPQGAGEGAGRRTATRRRVVDRSPSAPPDPTEKTALPGGLVVIWWSRRGSNPRPLECDSCLSQLSSVRECNQAPGNPRSRASLSACYNLLASTYPVECFRASQRRKVAQGVIRVSIFPCAAPQDGTGEHPGRTPPRDPGGTSGLLWGVCETATHRRF